MSPHPAIRSRTRSHQAPMSAQICPSTSCGKMARWSRSDQTWPICGAMIPSASCSAAPSAGSSSWWTLAYLRGTWSRVATCPCTGHPCPTRASGRLEATWWSRCDPTRPESLASSVKSPRAIPARTAGRSTGVIRARSVCASTANPISATRSSSETTKCPYSGRAA